jgi:hypothetical protein
MRPPPTLSRLLILCLLATMGGCASVDLPPAQATPAPKAETQRALPAWDALATELAERIVNRLSEMPAPPASPPAGNATSAPATHAATLFHLSAPAGSAFDKALLTLFGQRLLSLGLGLDGAPGSGQIDLNTQLIERPHRPPLLLVSTQVRAHGRLLTSTADLYALDASELPLFVAPTPAPPVVVKTWRMAPP